MNPRYAGSVGGIFRKFRLQIRFFSANHRHVDDGKHREDQPHNPDVPGGDGKTGRDDNGTEIQRIASVSVGPGRGQFLVLFYMARSQGTQAVRRMLAMAAPTAIEPQFGRASQRYTAAKTNPRGTRVRRAILLQLIEPFPLKRFPVLPRDFAAQAA